MLIYCGSREFGKNSKLGGYIMNLIKIGGTYGEKTEKDIYSYNISPISRAVNYHSHFRASNNS